MWLGVRASIQLLLEQSMGYSYREQGTIAGQWFLRDKMRQVWGNLPCRLIIWTNKLKIANHFIHIKTAL